MSFPRENLVFLWSLSLLLVSGGCAPTKPTRVAAVAYTAEDVFLAASKQSDPTIVRAGTPAYLMLVDGLIEAYPDNSELLIAGCQAYTAYALSLIHISEPTRLQV